MIHDESYGDLWRRSPLRVGLAKNSTVLMEISIVFIGDLFKYTVTFVY